jgi:gliding motility-associated-like protein
LTNFNSGNAIENLEDFSINSSTTTIIAEVVNIETLCVSPSQVSFDIFVNPLPDFNLPENVQVCIDSNTNEVIDNNFSPPVLDTTLSENAFDFEWFLDGVLLENNASSLVASSAGNYEVIVTDVSSNCSFSQNTTVEAINPPLFNVDVLSPAFSGNNRVQVNTIQGSGDFEFQLDDGPWLPLSPGQDFVLFENVSDGVHIIRGRDLSGCGIYEVQFTVLGFSPFFTPNADGINDYWNIRALQNQPEARIYIFDRYGKLIYEANPLLIGWGGTYQGRQMPSQDYWFRVEFTDPQTNNPAVFSGHFTLKR